MKQLHFSIDGEFITNLARKKVMNECNLQGAIDLLESALETDDLNDLEQMGLIFNILLGNMAITGTYPSDDYGIIKTEKNKNLWHNRLKNLGHELKDLRETNERLMEQLETINETIPESYKSQINAKLGETVFPEPDDMIDLSKLRENNDDYGWLTPDGIFMPTPFVHHEQFATQYMFSHTTQNERMNIMKKYSSRLTDWLIYDMNFILLHNPAMGPAQITHNPNGHMTKKQKDFLYDYLTKRGQREEANALF